MFIDPAGPKILESLLRFCLCAAVAQLRTFPEGLHQVFILGRPRDGQPQAVRVEREAGRLQAAPCQRPVYFVDAVKLVAQDDPASDEARLVFPYARQFSSFLKKLPPVE